MSMDRATALIYLQNQYATVATLTGQITTDAAAGYGPAIDDALMSLGTAYADLATATVEDTLVPAYRALLRYHALRHFEQRLAVKVDFDVVGSSASVQKKQSAQLAQIRAMLAEAAAAAGVYGYAFLASTIQTVRYSPDVPYRVDLLIP